MIRSQHTQEILASRVEIFADPISRARGLTKFDQAPTNYAAVFELAFGGVLPVVHTFGMKFEIDLALCDAERRVRFLKRGVKRARLVVPWRFLMGGCRYLVEFSEANTEALAVGERLEWAA